jgi:homoserine O-acetyltransferase/O-succinyltransferase
MQARLRPGHWTQALHPSRFARVSNKRLNAAAPLCLDLTLDDLTLEGGGTVCEHKARVWLWTEEADLASYQRTGRVLPGVPTVLFLPPLHHGADPTQYWDALIGPGRRFQAWNTRLVSVALLGADGGSTGPDALPRRHLQAPFTQTLVRGKDPNDDASLPAIVTTLDQARAVGMALRSLGIESCASVLGGSLGGMVAQAMLCQDRVRVESVVSIAAPLAATATMIGWSHVEREALRLGSPALARQIARMVYRGAEALQQRQGRDAAGPRHEAAAVWTPRAPFRMETYLRHHGDAFNGSAASYALMLSAMDHHDLRRYALLQQADVADVRIDSDAFVSEVSQDALCTYLGAARSTLPSAYGHDAFLVEGGALLAPVLVPIMARVRKAHRVGQDAGF